MSSFRSHLPSDTTARAVVLAALHSLIGAVTWWLYFALFAMAAPLSLVLIVLLVGIPSTLGLLLAGRWAADLERRLANLLLGTAIEAPVPLTAAAASWPGRAWALAASPTTWRSVAFLLFRMVLGSAAFFGILIGGGLTFGLTIVPFLDGAITLEAWSSSAGWRGLWAPPLAVASGLATVVGAAALAWVSGRVGELLLGPSQHERMRILERTTADLNARQALARELHDSVGHTMSAVVVQAGAARQVAGSDPEFAGQALADIQDAATRSLEELDGMLAILRDEGGAGLRTVGSSTPTLADLDQLLQAVRAAGLPVRLTVGGEVKQVPPEASAVGYRVVQEALTNVLRHAGTTATTVELDVSIEGLVILVANGRPVAGHRRLSRPGRRGRGLQGMRERLDALAGTLEAGPDGDGYRLRAWIPLPLPSVGR